MGNHDPRTDEEQRADFARDRNIDDINRLKRQLEDVSLSRLTVGELGLIQSTYRDWRHKVAHHLDELRRLAQKVGVQ